jgi:hypothetical protein
MDLGIESILIALFFLLPGFIATYIRLSKIPEDFRTKSSFQETLGSLSTSIPIFLTQLFVLLLLNYLIKPFRDQVNLFIQIGLLQYITINSILFGTFLLSWGLFTLILSIIFGFIDPIEGIADRNRKRYGISPVDFWLKVLQIVPAQNSAKVYARVWLKSGACYAGDIGALGIPNEKDNCRYFYLTNAVRWYSISDAQRKKQPERMAGVLLKSDDINSMDVYWKKI